MFSGIEKILFIGGNRLKEDGPLLNFISICRKREINVSVITDKERAAYSTNSMGTLEECLSENDIDYLVIEKLTVNLLKPSILSIYQLSRSFWNNAHFITSILSSITVPSMS